MGCSSRLVTKATMSDVIDTIFTIGNDVTIQPLQFDCYRIKFNYNFNGKVVTRWLMVVQSDFDEDLSGNIHLSKNDLYMILDADDCAVEILTTIAKAIGGYVNHNDCDYIDENYWKKY